MAPMPGVPPVRPPPSPPPPACRGGDGSNNPPVVSGSSSNSPPALFPRESTPPVVRPKSASARTSGLGSIRPDARNALTRSGTDVVAGSIPAAGETPAESSGEGSRGIISSYPVAGASNTGRVGDFISPYLNSSPSSSPPSPPGGRNRWCVGDEGDRGDVSDFTSSDNRRGIAVGGVDAIGFKTPFKTPSTPAPSPPTPSSPTPSSPFDAASTPGSSGCADDPKGSPSPTSYLTPDPVASPRGSSPSDFNLPMTSAARTFARSMSADARSRAAPPAPAALARKSFALDPKPLPGPE